MNNFAVPKGFTGRLAGWIMGAGEAPAQRELLPLVDAAPGNRVLEVGYGPGKLVELLLQVPEVTVAGVDPSEVMLDQARRRTRAHADRVDLRLGDAENTRFDELFDRVVSVNNVQIWGSLNKGLDELRRVTAPSGRLVVAIHSKQSRSRMARGLGLPEDRLRSIEAALRERYDHVERHALDYSDVFAATRT